MSLQHAHDQHQVEAEWDQFLIRSPRGHPLQLSTWLHSFRVFGFKNYLVLSRDESASRVVGGIGLIMAGRWPFVVMVAPIGPIVDCGYESLVPDILARAIALARAEGAILLQLRLPQGNDCCDDSLLQSPALPSFCGHRRGRAFDLAMASGFMLWVDFPYEPDERAWTDVMLKRFTENTRRNILKSQAAGLTLREAQDEESLRAAYAVIERNGLEQGYPTRTWKQFGPTLAEQVRRGHACVLTAYHGDQLLGSHYGVIAGRRYTYLMGGTVRTQPDRRVGHFLHWNAILNARRLGLSRYDMSSGGSPGVMRFKMGFSPRRIECDEAHYFVLCPLRTWIFQRVWPWVKRHRASVARVMQAGKLRRGDQ